MYDRGDRSDFPATGKKYLEFSTDDLCDSKTSIVVELRGSLSVYTQISASELSPTCVCSVIVDRSKL